MLLNFAIKSHVITIISYFRNLVELSAEPIGLLLELDILEPEILRLPLLLEETVCVVFVNVVAAVLPLAFVADAQEDGVVSFKDNDEIGKEVLFADDVVVALWVLLDSGMLKIRLDHFSARFRSFVFSCTSFLLLFHSNYFKLYTD